MIYLGPGETVLDDISDDRISVQLCKSEVSEVRFQRFLKAGGVLGAPRAHPIGQCTFQLPLSALKGLDVSN